MGQIKDVLEERRSGGGRDALEGQGPERRPQRRLGRRLEEVAKAGGAATVGYKSH